MDFLDAIYLGILQGITEFLPVSSSGHLVLGEKFLGLDVEELKSFDVIVHMGTLLAIVLYFWKDVWGMIKALFGKSREYEMLIVYIIVVTVPAVLAGLFLEDAIDSTFRNVISVGLWMILVGVFFILGERFFKKVKKGKMSVKKAVIIGLAQSLALIPGVSRSGSTIVAGLFQGIKRDEAARFSFLLGIPAIAGAGLYTMLKMPMEGGWSTDGGLIGSDILLVGFVSAFIAGIASIVFLMRFLKKHSLVVFSVYLFILGGSVLATNFL